MTWLKNCSPYDLRSQRSLSGGGLKLINVGCSLLITDRRSLQVEAFPQVFYGFIEIRLVRSTTGLPQYVIPPKYVNKPLKARLRCRAETDTSSRNKLKLEWTRENTTLETGQPFVLGERSCFAGLIRISCEHSLYIQLFSVVSEETYWCSAKNKGRKQRMAMKKAGFALKNGGMWTWCGNA